MLKRAKHLFAATSILIGFLFSSEPLRAQGTTSLFIDAGVGARALGLGNAYVASASDASAVFWNPAGLDFIEKKSVSFFYSSLIAESSYIFAGSVWPTVAIGSFGVGVLQLGSGGLQERGGPTDPSLVSTFDYTQQLFLFSWGKQVREGLSAGLTFKVENFSLNNSLTRFGADLGVLYRPDLDSVWLRDLSVGFNVQNFFKTEAKLVDEPESASRNLKVGLMKNVMIGEERNQLAFLLDWNKTQNATSSWHFGTEYSFNNQAKLRLGINDGQIAFGAGASYNRFHLDYNFGKLYAGEFAGDHRFSVTIEFGRSRSEEIKIAEERREAQFRIRADRLSWFRGEQEYTTRLQKGKNKYAAKDYLGAVVDFDRAKGAADSLVVVAQRLRGALTHDPEANLRVDTAFSLSDEAAALLDSANAKSEAQMEADLRKYAEERVKSEREAGLRRSVLTQRSRGTAFFKQSLFARAISAWRGALDELNGFDGGALPKWAGEIKINLENNIKMAETQLEGDVEQGIRRADALARRGRYVQAIQELNRLLRNVDSNSERRAIERKINRWQGQLSFDQNYNDGRRAYVNKDWQTALSAFERALKTKPNHAKAQEYFAKAKERALAIVKQFTPKVRPKFLRGMTLYREGKYAEALRILEQANKEQPHNKRILDLIDAALEKLNQQ